MKLGAKYYILCLFLITYSLSRTAAQNHQVDSLKQVLKTEKEDTNKVNTLNILGDRLWRIGKFDTIMNVAGNAQVLADKLGFKAGLANAYINIGLVYANRGNYPQALDYYLKALKMGEEMGDKYMQANTTCDIGIVYANQGNYPKALEYYSVALKAAEEVGNKDVQAKAISNIGIIYQYQGDYPQALEYYFKSLKMAEDFGSKRLESSDLSNIGVAYINLGDFPKALEYDLKSLKLAEELGDKSSIATTTGNIGELYGEQGNYPKSLEYSFRSLKMAEELEDKPLAEINTCNIGNAYGEQGDYPKAMDYFIRALKMSEESGDKSSIARNTANIGSLDIKTGKFKEAEEYLKNAIYMDSSIGNQDDLIEFEESISQLYDTTRRGKLALLWYKKARVIKDTLFNADKNKALTRKELTYAFEKKEAEQKADQDKKDALALTDKKKQKIIVWAVLGGLALVLMFAAFIFRSLRITRKQKKLIEIKNLETEKQKALIEQQKHIVEEKNKDILDSIMYAKRLQDAILPPMSIIKKYLPESFVLYKPKDIVAGDFYWMEYIPSHTLPSGGEGKPSASFSPLEGGIQGGIVLIAAADCTGHGVPGALVSVVCSNALNRTVKEFKITEPGKILDKVRELVLETFSQGDPSGEKSESNVQDGMDISLCCINTKTNEVQWSGAYNSLWYTQGKEIKEIAADKQPIGKVDRPQPFNTHKLNLKKGDSLYLFTDGYADQFGGPKGKKFKSKQLQQLIMDNAKLTMEEQKNMLDKTLKEWKGSLDQVDDILIIGIRV